MKILYEDNHVIAVVKPPNIPSQADSSGDMDMLSMVKEYVAKKYEKKGDAYIGLIHRLDRPTGGAMLFAKTSKAAKRLSIDIAKGRFNKEYLAVSSGVPIANSARLTDYLLKDGNKNIVQIANINTPNAKLAILDYIVKAHVCDKTLFEVALLTGRSHQIRVQLANIGCPIYGDLKYGGSNPKAPLALFSKSVGFYHPTKKEYIEISALPGGGVWDEFTEFI